VSRRPLAFAAPLLAGAVAVALAGCSGSVTGSGNSGSTGTGSTGSTTPESTTTAQPGRTVDASRLERAIAISAQAQRHQKAVVICPADVLVAVGSSFYCAAQAGGEVTPFLVTERAGGKLAFKDISPNRAPSVDMTEIEIEIAKAMRTDHKVARSVSCPQEMPRQEGLEFICVVTTGAKRPTRFIVRETNSFGRISFKPS
jgi:hypothetical protein